LNDGNYSASSTITVEADTAPEPTCNDGIQNGDETGIDCGGSCANTCPCVSDVVFAIDFENGNGNDWTTSGTANTGTFVVANPSGYAANGLQTQVDDDHSTTGTNAFFTATNTAIGTNDIDSGVSIATSPVYFIENNAELSLWYFFGQRDLGDDATGDYFLLEYSLDGGTTFTTLVSYGDEAVNAVWTEATATIPGGSNLVIQISASDGPAAGDIVEAGIDDVVVTNSCQDIVAVTGISVNPDTATIIEGRRLL